MVFLHGWGGSWQSWAPIVERLKKNFTVYALDLPGFGLSALPKPFSLDDYVAELVKFFEKQKIKKPVLIGHSFGGQIAAKFGKKVVGPSFRSFYYKIRGWGNSDYLKAASSPFLQETAGKIFREDLSVELSRITLPTLIFWGEKDIDTPLNDGRESQAKIANAKLVVVPGAGHFSYLDDQELFCKEMIKFIG